MASALAYAPGSPTSEPGLDRRTKLLVRLAALIAVDAGTESLRWAIDLAATDGADDDALAAVLVATAPAAGSAQLVASAPRLSHALGSELQPGTRADQLLAEEARLRRA
jgi:alkylhydroperoxidase/carboxymuconolactone decarboxylase family protein YurZ